MSSEEHSLYIAAIGKLSAVRLKEIAIVCYANVTGMFADFCNPSNRGPNFNWNNFAEMCIRKADVWMICHHVSGNKKYVNAIARQYTKEIATLMVDRSGFLESSKNET